MKLEHFNAGHFQKQFQYKSFTPALVNQEWTWDDPTINIALERATKAISELNAYSTVIPDVDVFIEMHIAKEAQTSSRIEGTQTDIEEAVMEKDQVAPERRDDWQEVQNYIQAMNAAVKELSTLPLSGRLLKDTHRILMQGVRGERKFPGEYRISQNWIGASLQDAVFIPPHHDEVAELMGDLEKFWHNEECCVPHLIKIAISHYQFETIHPFCDGNGRIGRLMIALYLVSSSFLNKPCLYLSDYFEKNRAHYYDALTTVRISNNMIHWVKFFLNAVAVTAENGIETFQKIMQLKARIDKDIMTLGSRAPKAHQLMAMLYRKPFVTVAQVAAILHITPTPAANMVAKLEELHILREVTGYKKNRIFVFHEYLQLFRR